MDKRYFLLFIFTLLFSGAFAKGNTKKVTVEYTYNIPPNVSFDEAKETAIHRAQAQAIADEFGTYVVNSSSIMIETSNENTNTDFLSIGGSELKGEWLETTSEPICEYVTNGSEVALHVRISGIIREIEGAKVPFEVKILRNGTSGVYESDTFESGDDLFISFKSPTSGYCAIYLIDVEKTAFCLLPYQQQENGFFPIKANARYVFFSPDNASGVDKKLVDEIIMDTTLPSERNRILTVFSPNKFFKAADNDTGKDVPRNLKYADFQKWLSQLKKHDTDVTIFESAIKILGKD